LQQVVEQVQNWHFTKENIEYLTSLNEFTPEFLDYLSKIKNHCSIKALPEGTPVFPREPIISISGPLIEAQLLETFILNIINHQSLIATKSWQINHAAQGRPIMEFGARRAQGPDPATYDISQLAIKARKMLDDAGFPKAKITASNALDAHVVKSLLDEGAPIDNFGIGERLITSSSSPVLSGVYKLAEEKINDQWIPKIKVSDSREKITLPGN
ncbi:nicotinate phosphoribosyltransferase, partial [Ligilactobacillus salivarius]|nr:nicotinate phosphoribosyltransferase [Ligilactobacillus salivarius]